MPGGEYKVISSRSTVAMAVPVATNRALWRRAIKGYDMIRFLPLMLLLAVPGCADQSRGAALNECQLRYYLQSPDDRDLLIPDCMKAKSFDMVVGCRPETGADEWNWQVPPSANDDQRCYRPIGATAWVATVLSPM
jgi:hypothetical protein